MIQFDGYNGDNAGTPVFVNPEDVACVRAFRYHTFRPAIAEIVLRCGEKIRVWETPDVVNKRVAKAVEAAERGNNG